MTDNLDKDFLQHVGGIENNSFMNLLQTETDINGKIKQPQIISHSPYHDMEKLIPLLTKSKNGFSIFSTNIQSIQAKFDELQIFVEHLRSFNFELSAICTQETFISDKDDLSQIELKGYTLIPQGKSCSKNGSLVVYLHEQFKHEYKL